MQIESNEIHIWTADLEAASFQENQTVSLLSSDELERANRFQFPIHRQRFIAGRSLLRIIIGFYTHVTPQDIVFSYEDKKKPFLSVPANLPLQFNLSHSNNMAVFALTMNHAIGVDIEKVQTNYPEGVALRFFHSDENKILLHLPENERPAMFYRMWARKEAIVKALGEGFYLPLSSFSSSVNDDFATIMVDNKSWSLLPLSIHPAYQSAVATNQMVKKMTYWKFIDQSPELVKIDHF